MDSNNSTIHLGKLLTLDNPVFSCYVFWCSVLVIKMILMAPLTSLQRLRYKILALLPRAVQKTFNNPEDELFSFKAEVKDNDPHVERVRRAHRNDMENILPFFTMGLIYICLDPNPICATVLFRIYAVTRIIHTLVYAFRPVPQPTRAIAFMIGVLVMLYMGLYVLFSTITHI